MVTREKKKIKICRLPQGLRKKTVC